LKRVQHVVYAKPHNFYHFHDFRGEGQIEKGRSEIGRIYNFLLKIDGSKGGGCKPLMCAIILGGIPPQPTDHFSATSLEILFARIDRGSDRVLSDCSTV